MTPDEMDEQYRYIMKAKQIAPHLPWNQFSADMLGPVIMEFMRDYEPYYRRWAAKFYENFQFLYGNHYLRFDRTLAYTENVDPLLARRPTLYQRSQTNIIRTIVESLSSFIFGTLPAWEVESCNESSVKANRAKYIIQALLDGYFQRLNMDVDLQVMANCFPLYGLIFSKVDWDDNAGTIIDIPIYDLVDMAKQTETARPNPILQGLLNTPTAYLDSQGKEVFEKIWAPKLNESGKPIVKNIFSGDLRHTVKTPFEMRRPVGSYGMHKDKCIQEIRVMDYDEWLDEYQHVGGKTKYFKQLRPIYQDPASFQVAVSHYMQMQLTTPPVFMEMLKRSDYGAGGRGILLRGKVLVIEHYDRPHNIKWPKGRRVVVTNGVCTHITVPNYRTGKMNGWHPYLEAQWMRVAPNSIGPGPVNDATIKNRELNQKDSLTATAARRNFGSTLLYKSQGSFDPTMMTGEPGKMIPVRDLDSMRFLHDDQPLPPILPQLRDIDKSEAFDGAGAGDSLRGERSPGTSSGYQARQYTDREERRLTPAKTSWNQLVAGVGEKLYTCLRYNVVVLNENLIGFLQRSAAGRFSVQDVQAFMTTPIEPGIDINVKKDSMAIRSKATQQATLQELAQGPFGQRLTQDAFVMDEYLKFFDAEKLRDRSAAHRDRAQRENSVFSDMIRLGPGGLQGVMMPIVIPEDDDNLHLAEHTQYEIQNTEELLQNEAVHLAFLMHMETHRIASQAKQGAVPPESPLMVPQMYASVMPQPQANATMVAEQQQQKMMAQQQIQQQQAMTQQAAGGGPQNPQAPKMPAEAGAGGSRPVDPNAPASNTPQGARQGGPT